MSARLLHVVTHPLSADVLLRGQLAWMRGQGFTVALASAPGDGLERAAAREGVEPFPVTLEREIAPARDVAALSQLTALIRRWRPDIVHASTPKAGLLGMTAAAACRVPARVYGQWGLRLETVQGPKRRLLWGAERATCALAHRVLCAGPSLKRRLIELDLAALHKVSVPASGSTNGVDPRRFEARPDPERAVLREQLGIPEGAPVIGFVGRLTRDKGIPELVEAFQYVRKDHPSAYLLLLGTFEEGDPVDAGTREMIRRGNGVVAPGFVPDPAPYYGSMSVLAFPSHREGFPNVPLEAACAGVPTVGFRATGTVDAVISGQTGLLVSVGDVAGLAKALSLVLTDAPLRHRLGEAARARVVRQFRPEAVWSAIMQEYLALLGGSPGGESTGGTRNT